MHIARLLPPLALAALAFAACGDWPTSKDKKCPTPEPRLDTATPAQPANDDQTWIRDSIRKLTDWPRTVPASGGRPAGVRGGPGNFDKLPPAQVDEIIAAVIYCADLFYPKSLQPKERYAIILVDMSAESSFRMETANANGQWGTSVNLQQVTIPLISNLFRQRAQIYNLHHYNGQPWDPKDTSDEMVRSSVWDGTVVANWSMTEMAKAGGANPRAAEFNEGGDGPMPHTVRSAWHIYNSGYPSARVEMLPEAEHYLAMLTTDLALLGFSVSIIDASF